MNKIFRQRLAVALVIVAALVIPNQVYAGTVTRKLPITKDGTTQVGWADAVITWNLVLEDECAAGTVSIDTDYPNVSVYAAAKDKNGKTISSKSAQGQVRVVLPTPLKESCDTFYSKHCVGNGNYTYCMTIST